MNILSVFAELLAQSGFAAITWQQCVMLLVSFVLVYLAIKKQFEPAPSAPDRIRYVPCEPSTCRSYE